MNKIPLPQELKNRKGVRGKTKTPTISEVAPYLPDVDCFFDIRHLVWGGVDEYLPFSITTRIVANCQQFLKITIEDEDSADLDEG